jgi:transposase-like protein
MGKHHTEDYKLSAVKYALRTDNQVETCEVFDCKRSSLQDWLKLYEETGSPVRDTKKQRTAALPGKDKWCRLPRSRKKGGAPYNPYRPVAF